MRSARITALALMLPVALAACTGGGTQPSRTRDLRASAAPVSAPQQMLVLDRSAGVEAIDPATGSVLFRRGSLTPLPNWSKAFSASSKGGTTNVREIDPETGAALTGFSVTGRYDIGAVAADGDAVALVQPTAGTEPWTPVARPSTTVVVGQPGDPSGSSERYHLHGNFAPEAFSSDGSELLMLQYLPATHPDSYRVVRLGLDKGNVEELYGRSKLAQPMGPMSGTRLQQVPAPDGSRLYTLYTDQPADYAREYSDYAHGGHRPVAFIHTLDLQNTWAYCVDLPRAFGSGDASAKAIALSTDGSRLYAVDTDAGLIAVMDTQRLKVIGVEHVRFGLADRGQAVASVAGDGGSLFVGRGSSVVEIGLQNMQPLQRWSLDRATIGLASSPDGAHLYVATENEVRVLDPQTGEALRSLPVSSVTGIAYLGTAAG